MTIFLSCAVQIHLSYSFNLFFQRGWLCFVGDVHLKSWQVNLIKPVASWVVYVLHLHLEQILE